MPLPAPDHPLLDADAHDANWDQYRQLIRQSVSNLLSLARLGKAGADLTARHADAPGVCFRELAASERRWEEQVMLLAELLDIFGFAHREFAEEVRLHVTPTTTRRRQVEADACRRLAAYFDTRHQELVGEGARG